MELNVVEMKDDLPQIPQASEFPHALAAMESMEPSLQEAESEAQWTIGDAVLQDIPIQPIGVKDGSGERLNRLAVLAESRGCQRYSVPYLRRLRSISYRFPDVRRRTSYPWAIHEEAGFPEILDKIIRMAEAEGVPVSSRYVRTKKREIDAEQTQTTSTGHWGATTQAGQNVIPMPLRRKRQPSLKEQVAVQAEELQEKEDEIQRLEQHIAGVYQVAESTLAFEVAQALARERLSPIPVMAKAIAEEDDAIVHAEVVDGGQQKADSDETHPEVCSAEELEQIVGSKTEPWEGLKSEALDAMDKLVDDFGDVADRYDLSDMEQRQMARYLFQQILKRKAFNERRESLS
jgi:hypothetical protein